MLRRSLAALCLTFFLSAFAASGHLARAGTILTYTDRAAWEAAAGPVTTETFDGLAPGPLGDTAVIGGVTYRSGGGFDVAFYPALAVVADVAGETPASAPNVFGPTGTASYEAQFAGAWVDAFGFDLIAPNTTTSDETLASVIFVTERDGTQSRFVFTLTSPGPHFVGFTSDLGIAQVILFPVANNHNRRVVAFLDDVSHSPITGSGAAFTSIGRIVPEPPAVVLLGLGLAGVAGWDRLRRVVARR